MSVVKNGCEKKEVLHWSGAWLVFVLAYVMNHILYQKTVASFGQIAIQIASTAFFNTLFKQGSVLQSASQWMMDQ